MGPICPEPQQERFMSFCNMWEITVFTRRKLGGAYPQQYVGITHVPRRHCFRLPKRMNFRKSSEGGGRGGVISNHPNIYIADLCQRSLGTSSVLVAWYVPNPKTFVLRMTSQWCRGGGLNVTEWMNVVQTRLEGGMYKYFVYNTHVTPLQKIFSRPQEHLAKIFSVQIFRIKHSYHL